MKAVFPVRQVWWASWSFKYWGLWRGLYVRLTTFFAFYHSKDKEGGGFVLL